MAIYKLEPRLNFIKELPFKFEKDIPRYSRFAIPNFKSAAKVQGENSLQAERETHS